MTNTLQTNTFVGGMNLDTDVTMIPDNQYRYAENVRVITDTDVLQVCCRMYRILEWQKEETS